MADARADTVVSTMGWTGRGVRVAVWERGPDDLSQLDVAAHFDSTRSAQSSHARLTSGIIKNTQSSGPRGFAPDCELHSANSYDLKALEWAVTRQRCTVISQSFHRDAEETDGTLSLDDRVKDYLAMHWPYPTIVQAAGNSSAPGTEFVNHKGYNSLAVASHDDGASHVASTSVFRNPTSPHADRELPELAANGTNVSAVGQTSSGTSFAAPAVAGTVALLQHASAALRHWPEGCRAILLAAAGRNLEGSTWWNDVWNDVDAKDGSGVLDAAESVRIARSRPGAERRGRDTRVGRRHVGPRRRHRQPRIVCLSCGSAGPRPSPRQGRAGVEQPHDGHNRRRRLHHQRHVGASARPGPSHLRRHSARGQERVVGQLV